VTGGTCAHCELPLGPRPLTATVGGEREQFCCYGCVLAQQVTRARGEGGAAATIVVRLGLALFFAMNVMMLSLPTYAPVVYGLDAGDGPLFRVLRILALVFAAPVLVLLGGPIMASAGGGVRAGVPNADALVILGTVAAYVLSVANTVRGRPEIYADTAAMLLVLVTVGRWLEARARAEAGAAVKALLAPGPAVATRVGSHGEERVAPAALAPGDVVLVRPGEAFPTDGVVVGGVGGVDEAALTGEHEPRVKEPGAAVAGGTCSVDGSFRVRVTVPAAASAAARIAALLDAARRERTAAERAADRASRWLFPLVLAVAGGAGTWWAAHAGVDRGVLVALAVLVVACPCALGIATPVAVWMGLAHAAARGVIVRAAPTLERAAAVDRVLFDKTGTLTGPVPRLVAVEPAGDVTADRLLAHAAALEAGLGHPLARATVAAAVARGVVPVAADDVRVVPGRGVRATIAGAPAAIGSLRFAADELGTVPAALGSAAGEGSVLVMVVAGRLLGTLRFQEAARPEAHAALRMLRRLGVGTGLLSGDMRADAVSPTLVPHADAFLGLLPEDKVAHLRALRGVASGRTLAMVGDGVNDAPALAAADVGIAFGAATDLARMTADVVMVGDDLRRVPWFLAHARRVRRVVRQNLAWAFGYNAGAVALAAAGALNPVVASLAMLASSLAVVANARRLQRDPTLSVHG